MAQPILQSVSDIYKAVILIPATDTSKPGRTNPASLTAEAAVVTLVDNTGAAIGEAGSPLSTSNAAAESSGVNESLTPLGASAPYTGPSRSPPPNASYFNARAYSDQASAANGFVIQQSLNGGTTWRPISTAAVTAAGTAITQSVKLTGPAASTLYRVLYNNGTVAQGVFECSSSFTVA